MQVDKLIQNDIDCLIENKKILSERLVGYKRHEKGGLICVNPDILEG